MRDDATGVNSRSIARWVGTGSASIESRVPTESEAVSHFMVSTPDSSSTNTHFGALTEPSTTAWSVIAPVSSYVKHADFV